MPALTLWSSVVVLLALAARSAARLLSDWPSRNPHAIACNFTSKAGDSVHLAMAIGMVVMIVPLGLPSAVLTVFFSVTTVFSGRMWLQHLLERRGYRLAGAPKHTICHAAHAFEPHHVLVGLAMIPMAARMDGMGAHAGSMMAMPQMASAATWSSWFSIGTLSLVYTWAAVVILGGGLAKAATTRPVPSSPVGILSAPITVYVCELVMTVVMGLMLLA